ncbi:MULTISPECIES: hypothetical protein [Paraburkholderia]|uniref:Uncharacterized protein n=1 Tax=Paraburkholderia podalyriae TaxID=1938811 RepID=A0ABR7PZT3_9BURK|nr:hypothetical protein [Paraburkholderia podalyriae]MBC8751798.1 hypothetical protein [Paraburkholderia podalyriae]
MSKSRLQKFARNNRQLDAETQRLDRLTLQRSENTYQSPWMLTGTSRRKNLELSLPILGKQESGNPEDAIDDGMQKLAVYQDIRATALNAQRTSGCKRPTGPPKASPADR